MKYLLNGVAIAAALALITPVWAQAPMSPSAPKPAAAAPAPKAAAAKQMHRPMRHYARRHHMHMAPGDEMTEQLNREELSRLQGGAPPPPPPPPPQGPPPGGH